MCYCLSQQESSFSNSLFTWKTIIITQCLGKEGCVKVTNQYWGSQTSQCHVGVERIEIFVVVSFSLFTQASPCAMQCPRILCLVWASKGQKEFQQCGDLAVRWEWSWETRSFSHGNTRNDNFPATAVRTQAQQGSVGWSVLLSLGHVDFRVLLSGKCKAPAKVPKSDWLQGLDPMCLLSLGQIIQIPCCWFLFLSLSTSFCDTAAWQVIYLTSFDLPRSWEPFGWETWEIRIGVYISHFMTLNLKGKIALRISTPSSPFT